MDSTMNAAHRLSWVAGVVIAVVMASPQRGFAEEAAPPVDEPAAEAEPPEATDTPESEGPSGELTLQETEEVDAGRPLVHDHVVRVGLGMGAPPAIWGVSEVDRSRIYEMGATSGQDAAVLASTVIEYRRNLLAVRLAVRGRVLAITDGFDLKADDGVRDQQIWLARGGGYLSVAALAGIQWEPTIYEASGRSEGLSVALSALGGFEHSSVWGSLEPERVPNYRHPSSSFHWVAERERIDAEVALRWRHVVAGGDIRHLLGIELGASMSFLLHIPYLSYVSEPIRGVEDAWGSWMIYLRLIYEIGLSDA